jgi:hypothetical protein
LEAHHANQIRRHVGLAASETTQKGMVKTSFAAVALKPPRKRKLLASKSRVIAQITALS